MGLKRYLSFAVALAVPLALSTPATLLAQDDDGERDPGWYDQAEFSFVLTGGNSSATTFGLKNELERLWTGSKLTFNLGGLRVESADDDDRFAVGTPGDFDVVDDDSKTLTAENYFANLRYDRDISDRTYLYGLGGWERNRFSGIDNRWTGALGIGRKLIETDRTTLQADIGFTVTSEEPVVGPSVTFAGARLTAELDQQLSETATFTSKLVVDENLEDTDDLRAVWDNSIAVDISDALALKSGLVLSWDNVPALEEIPLFDTPGGTQTGTVITPLEELDTTFTAALVVTL